MHILWLDKIAHELLRELAEEGESYHFWHFGPQDSLLNHTSQGNAWMNTKAFPDIGDEEPLAKLDIFRTPATSILSPLEQLSQGVLGSFEASQLETVERI